MRLDPRLLLVLAFILCFSEVVRPATQAPTPTGRASPPRRVVIVLIDALRPDHLGVYGQRRATSPMLDALARGAVVFEQARAVAPWTLPSVRALLSGRYPDDPTLGATLQGSLRARGWRTGLFAANPWLDKTSVLARDWDEHRFQDRASAAQVVTSALGWLAQQKDAPALLMLHLMDVHLPYQEPATHRKLFAGPPIAPLGETFRRFEVLRAKPPLSEAERQYVIDRYDNNVRFVDEQLRPLFAALRPDDVIVVCADHGEEFWDQDGFEHGHTLHDSVLRTPLILRAHDVKPQRSSLPVALLDVTPTLLDLLGVRTVPMEGASLLPALAGERRAVRALTQRSLVLGWPMYGGSL